MKASKYSQFGKFPFYLVGTITGLLMAFFVFLLRSIQRSPEEIDRSSEPGNQYQATSADTIPGSTSFDLVDQLNLSEEKRKPSIKSTQRPVQQPSIASSSVEGSGSQITVKSPRWSLTTKYLVGVGLVVLLVIFLFVIRSVYPLLIIAFLIAFIVRPVIHFFMRRLHLRRTPSTLISYLLVLVIFIIFFLILLPRVIDATNTLLKIDYLDIVDRIIPVLEQTSQTINRIPGLNVLLQSTIDNTNSFLRNLTTVQPAPIDTVEVTIEELSQQLGQTLGVIVRLVGPIFTITFTLIFMLMISIYMSLSGEQFHQWYPTAIPIPYREEITNLIERIDRIWVSFLKGQIVLMVLIGLMVWLGNLILGTPQPLLLGVIAGVLELIPNLGPTIATIPAVILAVLFGSSHFSINNIIFSLIVILMYVLIQQLENNVIVPKVMGDAVNLPALVILIGVVIFGSLFGILGVFLATPIIATGREVLVYIFHKLYEPPLPLEPSEVKLGLFDRVVGWVKAIPQLGRKKDVATNSGNEIEGQKPIQ
jgi:predicted PurR-regulated permease PerM